MKNTFLHVLIFLKILLLLSFGLQPILTGKILAEEQKEAQDSNQGKEEESYPGQIKVDQRGNKIKKWSTKGPVKVTDLNPQQGNSNLPAGAFINVTPNQLNRSCQHKKVIEKAD